MATNELQNYTLGRGKIHFSRFKPGTQIPVGFRYIGNTPELNLTIETEELPHYSSDGGIRVKDDSVPLEVTRTGSMITDSIRPENVALFFFGTASVLTQASVPSATENFPEVKLDHSYKLGISNTNPAGYFGIDPAGFAVTGGSAAVPATGTLTFSGVPANNDTVVIDEMTYTLKAAIAAPYDVLIGADAAATAANLRAAINAGAGAGVAYGVGTVAHPEVVASGAAEEVIVTATTAGTTGNSIATTETGNGQAWGGATLTGGSGTGFVAGEDFSMNYDLGLLTILSGGSISENDNIAVTYAVRGSTRDRVISGTTPIEGAMIYEADNPKGKNFHYYFPYIKVTPNGDYALKGDEWQSIPFTLEALKPSNGQEAIYMDGQPVYQ